MLAHTVRRNAVPFAGLLCAACVLATTSCGAKRGAGSPSFIPAASISAGGFEDTGHTCILVASGNVKCWGDNEYGELGDGTMTNRRAVVVGKGVTNATAISAGGNETCSLLSGGNVMCWGFHTLGLMGGPRSTSSSAPLPIRGVENAVAVSTSGGHACAVISSGSIKCWGADNLLGTLGSGTAGAMPLTGGIIPAARVKGISNAVSVSAGYSHVCALLSSGTVECWGENPYGELGNGPTGNDSPPSPAPVVVKGINNARAVSVGDSDTCALLSDGTVKCWGWNEIGQLGNGQGGRINETPVAVKDIANATAISMGGNHACAIHSGGRVKCWGENLHGQLGDGVRSHSHSISWGNSPKYDFSPVPVDVRGISNATAISAGSSHTCAALSSGSVVCWGDNVYGQLGDGKLGDSASPVEVVGVR